MPQHQTPGSAGRSVLLKLRFWLTPIVIALALLSGFAMLYFGGILNPTTNLRHFPIAIVNLDTGQTGKTITDGLVTNMDKNQFDLRVLSADEARHQLDTGKVYAQLLLPEDLTQRLLALPQATLQPGQPAKPVITILTNPRASAMGAAIAEKAMDRAMATVNAKASAKLTPLLQQLDGGATPPGGASLALTSPIDVQTVADNPLPSGTGAGLSAFYFSLMLLIGGVSAAIVVSMTTDALLGYVPAEFGPWYRLASKVRVSRLQTLLVEWALVLLLGFSSSAVYLWIASALGMPVPHPWSVWLFGAFVVTAVGITSTSLIAALGSLGTLISLFVFLFFGLPSTGATIPLEATPRFFGWLAGFEPMRQAFLGSRALLYFDGRADAGLSRALMVGVIGLAIGLVFGAVVSWFYDRKGIHRIEAPPQPATEPAAPPASAAAGSSAGDGGTTAARTGPADGGSKEQAAERVSAGPES
ncbi:MAG: YhgE/Pip domain-containing protein [Mycobacterium sp.]|uniref:YhgE/Pip domain-containing protein n=1 Tax=Mycobacterium sp. TaxID=1785 RepID=UPI003F9D1B85